MRKTDKIALMGFVTRTGMYINPVDDRNIVSFIHGYEAGTRLRCDFTQLLKETLTHKYKVYSSSDGWPGQIDRLSKKRGSDWTTTFKKVTIEIIANEGMDKVVTDILKKRIVSLIGRIENPYFGQHDIEEWKALCPMKSLWFKKLWTDKQWLIVKSINKLVIADDVFHSKLKNKPTTKLLSLKLEFDKCQ